MEPIQTIILNLLTALGTGTITWFFARRKNKAEAHRSEIGNIDAMLTVYQKMLDDLSDRLTSQKQIIELQENEIKQLKEKINHLKTTR